jgi:hypothetical protein
VSIFGKLLKTAVDVATSPIAVVKDVATLGGAITDQRKPYTAQKLDQLGDDLEEIREELDDL